MLGRLPITLVSLKAGNNSENLKNKTFTIVLVPIKKVNQKKKKTFGQYHLKRETIVMNTGKSQTNESHKVRLTLADKLNLKDPNKNMAFANLSIYYT